MQPTRRSILRAAAAVLPLLTLGACGFVPEEVPESIERFPRTPIAGDMTSSRVVIAFYVADDSAVTLRVWTDEAVVIDMPIEPSGDGFHKVMIDDLSPGVTYTYAVFGGRAPRFENRSLIGRVRTALPDDSTEPVRLAVLSCIGQGTILPDYYMPASTDRPTTEPFQWELFTHAADKEIDALLHLGDQAYLDFVWLEEGGTREAYLSAWGYYHGGGYRDLYPVAGLYATWDDHESTDNRFFDPWDLSDEDAVKLANAQEAWYRVNPIDAHTPSEATVWRAFRWGKTVEVVLLDCRYELTEDRMMSPEQLDWLIERLESSPCRFVCVVTPKPFAQITSSSDLADDNADRWESYPPDRERVLAAIDGLDGTSVVFVTGDIHTNYFGRTSLDGERPSERCVEVCCTSGNLSPFAASLSDEQFPFIDNTPHLPILTFDPEAGTVSVEFWNRYGELDFSETVAV